MAFLRYLIQAKPPLILRKVMGTFEYRGPEVGDH